jgi:hypothetical protein
MTFEIFGITLSLWGYIIIFIICSLVNVALNTAKTIIMHKEEKISSSIINAITYGFYAIIVVMTASALDLWITILITAITNLIGVYGSMWLLERFKQDSLWEITATIKAKKENSAIVDYLIRTFEDNNIPFSIIECYNKEKLIFNIYSHNQKESVLIKKELDYIGAKYIVHEERVKL